MGSCPKNFVKKNYCTLAKRSAILDLSKRGQQKGVTMIDFDKLNNPANHYDGYYSDLADELEERYPDDCDDMEYYEDDDED